MPNQNPLRSNAGERADMNKAVEFGDMTMSHERHVRDGNMILKSMMPLMKAFRDECPTTRDLGYIGSDKRQRTEGVRAWKREQREISRTQQRVKKAASRDDYRCNVATRKYPGDNDDHCVAMQDLASTVGYESRSAEIEVRSDDVALSHVVTLVARTTKELEGLPDPASPEAKGVVVLDPRLGLVCAFPDYARTAHMAARGLAAEGIGIRNEKGEETASPSGCFAGNHCKNEFVDISLLADRFESFYSNARLMEPLQDLPRHRLIPIAANYRDRQDPEAPDNGKGDVAGPSR